MTGGVTPVELFVYINFVCDEETQRKLFGTLDMQKPAHVHTQLVTTWFECPLVCFVGSSDPDHISKHKFQVNAFLLMSTYHCLHRAVGEIWVDAGYLTVQNC